MPKGSKKRAKLKKQQPNDSDVLHSDGSVNVPPNIPHVDVSEDSMESSEETVTPKAVSVVSVERAVESVEEAAGGGEVAAPTDAGEQQEEARLEGETPVVTGQEVKGEAVMGGEETEASGPREAAVVGASEVVARGPAVAVAATGQQTTWWNCCGLLDAFSGSGR